MTRHHRRWQQGVLAGATVCTVFCSALGAGQDLANLDLEDLLKTDITITSVSNKEESLGRAAAAVTVLTAEEIRHAGVRNLPDALRLVPGLYVAQIDGGGWAVSARGIADRYNNKMLVLRDGRSVYSPLFAGVYWDLQDTVLEDIERIEVIKGPGGTIWGANAVNGVINIVTKKAGDTPGILITAGGGSFEKAHGGLRWGTRAGPGALRVFGQGEAFAPTVDNDGERRDDARRAYRGGFRYDQGSGDDRLMVQGEGFNQPAHTFYRFPAAVAGGYTIEPDHFNSRGGHALIEAHKSLAERNRLGARLYYDRAERTQSFLGSAFDTVDVQAQHDVETDRNALLWGAGFRWWRERNTTSVVANLGDPAHTHRTYNAFLQDELKIVPERFSITAGSKFEWNDFTGTEIQPRVNTVVSLNDRHALWGAVSRAVRTPSQVETTGNFRYLVANPSPLIYGVIHGNTDLRSETLMAYEGGYRGRPTARTSLDVSAYYNHYERLINIDRTVAVTPPPMEKPLPFRNGKPGYVFGGEISGRWNPTRIWTLSSAYSYYQEHLSTDDRFEASYPKHMIRAQSYWEMTPTLGMTDTAFYYSTIHINHADRKFHVDPYWRFDVALNWRPSARWEFLLAGRNLLDPRHPEYGQIIYDEAGQIPRSIYAQVSLKI